MKNNNHFKNSFKIEGTRNNIIERVTSAYYDNNISFNWRSLI